MVRVSRGVLVLVGLYAILLGLLPVLASGQSPPPDPCHLRCVSLRRVTGTLSVRYSVPNLTVTDWALITPHAPPLAYQETTDTTIAVQGYAGSSQKVQEYSFLARPMAQLPVSVADQQHRHGLDATFRHSATLWRRDLVAGAPLTPVPPLSSWQRKAFLAVLPQLDHDNPGFRTWLQQNGLTRGQDERDLDFAYRVFRFLITHFTYTATPDPDRRPSEVCTLGEGDCGALSLLFAAAMRANGIPARTLWGRWAFSQTDPDYHQWHVNAEVFAEGVGWVHVNVANTIVSYGAQEYFGRGEGDFITFHVDTDLDYDSLLFGRKQAWWMQGPHWWVKGSGCFDGSSVVENWTVQDDATYHLLAITDGPAGLPNPGASGEGVCLVVEPFDSLGHWLEYVWTAKDSGGAPAGTFDDPANASPWWTAPENHSDDVAEYAIEVELSCAQGAHVTRSYVQRVMPAADVVTLTDGPAGTPNPVDSGGQVQLGVTAEDSRAHGLSYQWTATDGQGAAAGTFDDPTAADPAWTAPENRSGVAGEYTIEVTATCTAGQSATGSYKQRVRPLDEVVITAGPTGTPNPASPGEQVALSVTAEDTMRHALSYRWWATDGQDEPAGSFDDESTRTPIWTAPGNLTDTMLEYTIGVVVTCDADKHAGGQFVQQVKSAVHSLTVTDLRVTGPPGRDFLWSGEHLACWAEAEDTWGHVVDYGWQALGPDGQPVGNFDDATAQEAVWTAPAVTDPLTVTITVTASCGQGLEDSRSQDILVQPRLPGDLDGDGRVDEADLLEFVRAWRGAHAGSDDWNRLADLDGDGLITVADASAMIRYLLVSAPAGPG